MKQSLPFDRNNKPIKSMHLAIFSRQMATLIQAGVPLMQSLMIIARGHTHYQMKSLVECIKKEVESGSTFADALRKNPQYFNELFCNIIAAGEQTGSLNIMLEKVATYKEKIETMKRKMKKASMYPIIVLVVAIVVTTGLLTYVVPEFESLFESFGAELPLLTRVVLALSRSTMQYATFMIGVFGISVYGFFYAKKHSTMFAYKIDALILKLPIIGRLIQKAAIARFTRTLSITVAAGLPLVDALRIVTGVTGNHVYTKATTAIRQDVSNGYQLHLSLENTRLFSSMVIQMVEIGEESGALVNMLNNIADFYEESIDNALDALSGLLEPLIMAILGIIVGGLVIAMYLPIFKLGAVV